MRTLSTIGAVGTAAAYKLNDVTLPFLGVPLTAFGMAAMGATLSFAFSDSKVGRRKMFFMALASTIAGASCVTVVPELMHLEISPVAQPPLAFLLALFMPWLIPALRGALPSLASGIFNALGKAMGAAAVSTVTPPAPPPAHPTDKPPTGY